MKSMASFDELIRTANSKYWWWHYVKVTETERLKKKKQTNGNNNCDPLEEYMVRTVIRAFSSHFKMKYKTVDYIAIVQRKKYREHLKLPSCSLQSRVYGIDYSFKQATVFLCTVITEIEGNLTVEAVSTHLIRPTSYKQEWAVWKHLVILGQLPA